MLSCQGTVCWNWWSRASACGYVQELCPFQIHPETTVRHAPSPPTYQLSKSLTLANKLWSRVATDVRLAPLLKNIGNKQYLGRDYLSTVKASGQVSPDQLDLVRYTPTRMFHASSRRVLIISGDTLQSAAGSAVDASLHETLALGAQTRTSPHHALGSTSKTL